MIGGGFRLFRVLGIDIRVHPSWLIVFVLVAWSLAADYFPATVPGLGPAMAWLLGAVAALLFFASVLAHELSHSVVARSRGIGVHSITLFIFGGVSSLTGDARSPGTEFLVSVVGPLTSVAIAIVAIAAAAILPVGPGPQAVLAYLGLVNVLVGVFNLIPGFPLDGGRVLRSIVWRLTGNVATATRVAALGGQLVGYGLMFWGIVQVFTGNMVSGLWSVAIGWFLQSAASGSVEQMSIERALGGIRVRDVYRPDTTAVTPDRSVEEVAEDVLLQQNRHSVPVADGRVLGMVTVGDIGRVPRERRSTTPISEVMNGGGHVVTVSPGDSLRDAMEALRGGDFEQIPVVEDGRLVGLLTRGDVMRAIQLRRQLDPAA